MIQDPYRISSAKSPANAGIDRGVALAADRYYRQDIIAETSPIETSLIDNEWYRLGDASDGANSAIFACEMGRITIDGGIVASFPCRSRQVGQQARLCAR